MAPWHDALAQCIDAAKEYEKILDDSEASPQEMDREAAPPSALRPGAGASAGDLDQGTGGAASGASASATASSARVAGANVPAPTSAAPDKKGKKSRTPGQLLAQAQAQHGIAAAREAKLARQSSEKAIVDIAAVLIADAKKEQKVRRSCAKCGIIQEMIDGKIITLMPGDACDAHAWVFAA